MSSDEEDPTETEEEAEPSPKKRRLVKGLKPSASEEEIDLKDEVDEDRECYLQNGNCDHFQGVIFTFWQVSLTRVYEYETRRPPSNEVLKRLNVSYPARGGIFLS